MHFSFTKECTEPCRKVFVDINECQIIACKDILDKKSCEESCSFLQKIYMEKPGICPQPQFFGPSNECTAVCQFDGDCPEAQKCCTVGCGRKCVKVKRQDIRLLPTPIGISVVERKRKRSAILRWVMQKMSRSHISTNANLYVIQWKWSVHKDEKKMTEWQAIMVKNKMYAIMKHLLSPGRYYQFRVAAVNLYGSRGYSNSSTIFRLSKEARAPGQPTNIMLGNVSRDSTGLWSQKISWKPPQSDLPIKNYVLMWQNSSIEEANAYDGLMKKKTLPQQGKRSAVLYSDDIEDDDEFAEPQRMSTILPAYSTSTKINDLPSSSVFLVEVHAVVDSSDGELRGEKAIVFVRTPADATETSKTQVKDETNEVPLLAKQSFTMVGEDKNKPALQFQVPYYEKGSLKTKINWSSHPQCSSQYNLFVVRWRLTTCEPFVNQKKIYYDLDKSGQDGAVIKTRNCFTELNDLNFSCHYSVEIKTLSSKEANSRYLLLSAFIHLVVAEGEFKTVSCQQTASDEEIACGTENLRCIASIYSAKCFWTYSLTESDVDVQRQPIIGYRIAITNTETMESNETILPASVSSIHFQNLLSDTTYNVISQTITNIGIQETWRTTFKTMNLNDNENLLKQEKKIMNESDDFQSETELPEDISNLELDALPVDKIIEIYPSKTATATCLRWSAMPLYLSFMYWLLRLRFP